jgi:hypothetical protein
MGVFMALRVVEASEPDEVTLADAAELLGVHPNTVRNRIRSGAYQARKVPSSVGPDIYLIKRAELDLPPPPPPEPWLAKIKQAFWSDDPRVRRVQTITWIVGGAMNIALYSFIFGRAWELDRFERLQEALEK